MRMQFVANVCDALKPGRAVFQRPGVNLSKCNYMYF